MRAMGDHCSVEENRAPIKATHASVEPAKYISALFFAGKTRNARTALAGTT